MGRHADATRRRGVAHWLVAAIAVVVLLAGGTVAYIVIVNRGNAASTDACSGSTVMPVVASTGAYAAISEVAKDFDATTPVARSTCVTTSVHGFPGPAVVSALQHGWTIDSAPPPTVWASDSTTDLTALDATDSDLTAGRDHEPLASSPVVLAVRASDAVAVDGLTWSALAEAVGSQGTVQLPSGDPLTLALPDPRANRATAYALESMVSANGDPVSVGTVAAGSAQLHAVATASDMAVPDTAAALERLAAGDAPFNAVPVVESDLAAFNTAASEPLTAIYPGGGTAGDQLTTATLTGSWVDPTQSEAGAAFDAFLGQPAGRSALARGHVRVPGTTTPAVRGLTFTTPVTTLPAPQPGVADALAEALGLPAPGGAPTSAPTSTGSSTMGSSTMGSSTSTGPSTSSVPTTAPTGTTSSPTTSTGRSTTGTSNSTTGTSNSTTGTTVTKTSKTRTTSPPPPLSGPVVTLLQDVSSTWSTVVDGRSRLDYAKQGLHTAVTELAGGNAGLWTASSQAGDGGYATAVATAPVRETVGGTSQSARLTSAIDGLASAGSRTTYRAVVAAYQAASDAAVPGRSNRVVMITDGVDETPGVSRDEVVAQLTAIRDQGRGVELVILGVGEAAPDDALTTLAAAGGGHYVDVPQTPTLPEAIAAAVR